MLSTLKEPADQDLIKNWNNCYKAIFWLHICSQSTGFCMSKSLCMIGSIHNQANKLIPDPDSVTTDRRLSLAICSRVVQPVSASSSFWPYSRTMLSISKHLITAPFTGNCCLSVVCVCVCSGCIFVALSYSHYAIRKPDKWLKWMKKKRYCKESGRCSWNHCH